MSADRYPLIAVDPGAISGAYAVFFTADLKPFVGDLPVAAGQVDAAEFSRLIVRVNPKAAIVEHVHSMPKQGVASMFKFGMSLGIIHGVLLAKEVPVHTVPAGTWKRHFKLTGTDKDAARSRAIMLYPSVEGLSRKKDVGRADALLMGDWFLNTKE